MRRAAGAALSGFVQARRGVYSCARAALTSWECCALGCPPRHVSPRLCCLEQPGGAYRGGRTCVRTGCGHDGFGLAERHVFGGVSPA
eukprot:6879626-Prymnesium_polylepis.2